MGLSSFCGEQSLLFHRNACDTYVFVMYDNEDFMSLEHVCETEQHKTNVTDAFSFGGVLISCAQCQSYVYSVHINACSGFDAVVCRDVLVFCEYISHIYGSLNPPHN